MLRRLRIENLVVIREAELELVPGLNAITGETGAGKTILSGALGLLLGTGIPVIGINFGRVGFLASIAPDRVEDDLARVFAGEDLGVVSCDGMICSTPSGSTAYNLSNGGPVLSRGLDAMAITFIAPHSLDARPLVVPRGAELTVRNATPDVVAAVLADGHRSGDLEPERTLSIRLGEQRSLLATLPETTFFGRYRETFTSHP